MGWTRACPGQKWGVWVGGAVTAATLVLAACGDGESGPSGALPPATGGTPVGAAGAGGTSTGGVVGTGGDGLGGDGSGGDAVGGTGGTGAGGTGGAYVCIGLPSATCEHSRCDLLPGCTAETAASCTGEAALCSSFDDLATTCDDQWGCGVGANGLCFDYDTECSDLSLQEYCVELPGCSWNGLFCNGVILHNCGTRLTRAQCEVNPVCYWTASATTYCEGRPTACAEMNSETCEMQGGCTLAPATCSGTPAPCETLTAETCFLQPGCVLASGGSRTIVPTGIDGQSPDLVFDVFTVERAQNSSGEDALLLDFAELNRGNAIAIEHAIAIYLSANDVYGDADDFELYAFDTPFQLPPYGLDSAVLSGLLPMPTADELEPGFYHPIGVLDAGGVLIELEKANNVLVLPPLFVGPHSYDLVAVSASHALADATAPGTAFEASLTILNASSAAVAEVALVTYLSADAALDAGDLALDCPDLLTLDLDSLVEGTFVLACTVPRLRGAYNLIIELDPSDALGDADRTNNVVVAATPITVDAPAPDLQVADLTSDLYDLEWQGAVTLGATVSNTGIDPAPATTVTFAAGGDTLCTASVAALEAGASAVVSADCTLGAEMVGTLTLSAQVDAADTVFEVNEANNTASSGTDLTVAPPDINLVAAGIGTIAGGASRSAGQTLPVYYEIENDGTDDAPPFSTMVYASVDATISEDDLEFCYRDAPSGQPAGSTTAGSAMECTVPTLPTGEYFLGMIVDTDGEVPETDESDNVAVDALNKLTIVE